jgi:Flp pilus assembly pilin Flp
MGRESGQATVEWTALLLLVALVLVAAGQLASRADGTELGTTLAHSLTPRARPVRESRPKRPSVKRPSVKRPSIERPSIESRAESAAPLPAFPPRAKAAGRDALARAGRGAGGLWRRAWFACLVYERTRYAFRHPESRLPGYTLPYGEAIRMINGCVSPVDLLDDIPGLDPRP